MRSFGMLEVPEIKVRGERSECLIEGRSTLIRLCGCSLISRFKQDKLNLARGPEPTMAEVCSILLPLGVLMKSFHKKLYFTLGLLIMTAGSMSAASNIYSFNLPSIEGKPMPLSEFKGKVILIVNVASQCGYTPQYKGLESLYEKYKDRGFVIVGFPANNFGAQEPGTNEEIKTFCSRKYNVSFPMYSKVSVKGEDQVALYKYLTTDADPTHTGEVKWNFTKFLVGRDGQVVNRFEPAVTPESPEIVGAVEKLLQQ
jgi:glutathione peroxidase